MRLIANFLTLFSLLVLAQPALASSFRIDFSGTFSADCIDCWAHDTGALRDTDFSGYVIIPDDGMADPDAGVGGETLYYFDSNQAYFELDTVDDRFDYAGGLSMTAYVFDGGRDRFSLFFYTDDYYFDMGMARNTAQDPDPLDDETMPTLSELQLLATLDDGVSSFSNYFSIGNAPGFDGWIANYDTNNPDNYNILNVTVSTIPIPPTLALFPAALLVLTLFRRRSAGLTNIVP
jgi:hypothetical protein